MLNFFVDWVFGFLPWKVQLGCLGVFIVAAGSFLGYLNLTGQL